MAFRPQPRGGDRRPAGKPAGKPASRPAAAPARKKFVYKPISQEAMKQRATRRSGRFDSPFQSNFQTFSPKVGDNIIRILPPTWDEADHYGFTVWMHRFIGADGSNYVCVRKMFNKKCRVCEEEAASKQQGETEEAKKLAPVEQFVCWVIDRKSENDSVAPELYPLSWTNDHNLANLLIDSRRDTTLDIIDPDVGYDVIIKRTGQGLNTRYQFVIDREQSPISDDEQVQDDILEYIQANPVPTTLKTYDYDYLDAVLSGTADQSDEELDNSDPEVAADETSEDEAAEAAEARLAAKRPARDDRRRPTARDDDRRRGGEQVRRVRQEPDPEPEPEEDVDPETGEVLEPALSVGRDPRREPARRPDRRTAREEPPPEEDDGEYYDGTENDDGAYDETDTDPEAEDDRNRQRPAPRRTERPVARERVQRDERPARQVARRR